MGFWNGFGHLWDDVSVGVIHALDPMGINVIRINLCNVEPHAFSKSYARDSSGLDFQQTCQELVRLRDQFDQKPVIFSCGEKPTAMLAEHSETLSKHFDFHWTNPTRLYRIIDKSRTPDVCREAGIAYPITHVTSSEEDVAVASKNFTFPCIVKPNLVNHEWNVHGGFPSRYFVARSSQELIEFYDKFPWLRSRTIWQKLIEGEDSNIFQCTALISRSGKVVASVCVRKLHQCPKGYGSLSYGRAEWNREVVSRTMKLAKTLGLTGYVSAEFKYHQATGEYYFIELNPRLPAYNAFFPLTGVNLAYLGYSDLTGFDLPDRCIQRNLVYWMTMGNISRNEPLRTLKEGAHFLNANSDIIASWRTFLDCQIKPYATRAIYKHIRR